MQIYDGRESFYQWDSNQKITSNGFAVGDVIHFYNSKQSQALTLVAYEFNGKVVADVPNILLQSSLPLMVYRYVIDENGQRTVEKYCFTIIQRPKPSDYVYTETEVLSYASLDERLKALENGSGGAGGKGEDGFSPIATVEQTAEGAIIRITDKYGTTNATITNGKDGKNGIDGKDGNDGYTPARGTDYWTDSDKAEIKSYVDETILGGAW